VGLGLLNYVKEQGYIFIGRVSPPPKGSSCLIHTAHGLRIQDCNIYKYKFTSNGAFPQNVKMVYYVNK
jgi:hypothetical protein